MYTSSSFDIYIYRKILEGNLVEAILGTRVNKHRTCTPIDRSAELPLPFFRAHAGVLPASFVGRPNMKRRSVLTAAVLR